MAEFHGVTQYEGVGAYAYTNWEADKVMTCICDWGFTGADCSLRMCPKGDDPITTLQNNPAVTMTVNATSGVMEGNFLLSFLVRAVVNPFFPLQNIVPSIISSSLSTKQAMATDANLAKYCQNRQLSLRSTPRRNEQGISRYLAPGLVL